MENAMDMTKTTSFNTPRLTLRLMTNEEWIKFIDHVFEADEYCLVILISIIVYMVVAGVSNMRR